MTYSVKAIFTYEVNNHGKFYEDMILSVKASSFDEAYSKAEKYAAEYCFDYVNTNNETVKIVGYTLPDCFLAYDEEKDVQEVYSRFMHNNSSLSEADYYEIITSQCDADELYVLRNKEFNNTVG